MHTSQILSQKQIKENALAFAVKWEKIVGNEETLSQSFLREFLEVFGFNLNVKNYEYKVKISSNKDGYIDYFEPGKIAIEMKSIGKNLDKAYAQLKEYMTAIPAENAPEILMVCDFRNIVIYRPELKDIIKFRTRKLHRYTKYFYTLTGANRMPKDDDEIELNIKASYLMANLHDKLKEIGYTGHELEVYLCRILFCLFADDTDIFPNDNFQNYIKKSNPYGTDLATRLAELFEILNTDENKRLTTISTELKAFRYINGGLFSERLPIAGFDYKMRDIILECCKFNWEEISPSIFGAMFQGVMDEQKRREMGAHYTSEENILKVIKPLFLDGLWEEYNNCKNSDKKLREFHDYIADLKFLDPACGCGNFLIVAYRELRLLEFEILKELDNQGRLYKKNKTRYEQSGQATLDLLDMLKVSVSQFYGIELEDFACQIATVGMWLVEHQINTEMSEHFGLYIANLPLRQSAKITNGNALRLDWEDVVSKNELSYIMGNPPFLGYTMQSAEQKKDMLNVFGKKYKSVGKLDFVTAWYKKSAEFTENTEIKCAFVSTNSIAQGDQVAFLWQPLLEKGLHINFGVPTFKWSNEAKGKAAVHCVIEGFSYIKTEKDLNPYLIKAPNIIVQSRTNAICEVPKMITGNRPADGGNLIIEGKDYEDFIKREPKSEKYIKRLMGAEEFINNKKRWCLWLVDCPPQELNKMPEVLKRIEKCRQMRLKSTKKATRESADYPSLFQEILQPKANYIMIPRVSSETRNYIPIGFLDKNIIASDSTLTVPDAIVYHFSILTSSVHMIWTRAVCGRLKSDYRYSKDIVYNNFPWATATKEQKEKIADLGQKILDTRTPFLENGASLADLYNPLSQPHELKKAHTNLDKAVLKLYGFSGLEDSEIVGRLFEMYQGLVSDTSKI